MTSHDSDVLIIGAGAAGHSAATTLRRDGFDGTVRVVHDEPVAPYNRTLVDKGILPGLLTPVQAALPSLASLGVEIVSGKASAIDPAERLVRLADATELPFRSLLLAVGSTPRPVLRNGEVEGVFPLHRAVDAQQIRSHVGSDFAGRVVTVLGAGLVGTEAASVFTASGARVHLVARSEVPLVSALGTPVATRLRDLHREHTIFHGGRTVTALRRNRPWHRGASRRCAGVGVRSGCHRAGHDSGDSVGALRQRGGHCGCVASRRRAAPRVRCGRRSPASEPWWRTYSH